jgi:hypothetical protein
MQAHFEVDFAGYDPARMGDSGHSRSRSLIAAPWHRSRLNGGRRHDVQRRGWHGRHIEWHVLVHEGLHG